MTKALERRYLLHARDGQIPTVTKRKFSLRRSLSTVYYTIAKTLYGFHVPQTDELFDEFIPGLVFDLAVEAKWISVEQYTAVDLTKASDFKKLGSYYVEAYLEEVFSKLIGEANENCWSMYSQLALEQRQGRRLNVPKFTTKEQRAHLLSEYRSKHVGADGTLPTVKSISDLAEVDKRNFKRWRDGQLLDSAEPSYRIAILLRANIQRGNRKKRKVPASP